MQFLKQIYMKSQKWVFFKHAFRVSDLLIHLVSRTATAKETVATISALMDSQKSVRFDRSELAMDPRMKI